MFGRRANLSVDINLCDKSPSEKCKTYYELEEQDTSAHLCDRQNILEQAKKNIIEAQAKQKEHYDRKHSNPDHFQVDQQVLRKDFTRKRIRGGKLTQRYLGPFTIRKVLPHGVYEISDEEGKKTRATGAHLKAYKNLLLLSATAVTLKVYIYWKPACIHSYYF